MRDFIVAVCVVLLIWTIANLPLIALGADVQNLMIVELP